MENIKVSYRSAGGNIYQSFVYAVDTTKHKFLVANKSGHFDWVYTADCRLIDAQVSDII